MIMPLMLAVVADRALNFYHLIFKKSMVILWSFHSRQMNVRLGYDVSGNQIKEATAKNKISNIEYK